MCLIVVFPKLPCVNLMYKRSGLMNGCIPRYFLTIESCKSTHFVDIGRRQLFTLGGCGHICWQEAQAFLFDQTRITDLASRCQLDALCPFPKTMATCMVTGHLNLLTVFAYEVGSAQIACLMATTGLVWTKSVIGGNQIWSDDTAPSWPPWQQFHA